VDSFPEEIREEIGAWEVIFSSWEVISGNKTGGKGSGRDKSLPGRDKFGGGASSSRSALLGLASHEQNKTSNQQGSPVMTKKVLAKKNRSRPSGTILTTVHRWQ